MTAAQIKQLLPGKTIVSPHRSNRPMRLSYSVDGTVTISLGKAIDTGKWWVEGNRLYCHQFPKADQGKKVCRYFYSLGNGRYRTARLDGTFLPNSFALE